MLAKKREELFEEYLTYIKYLARQADVDIQRLDYIFLTYTNISLKIRTHRTKLFDGSVRHMRLVGPVDEVI